MNRHIKIIDFKIEGFTLKGVLHLPEANSPPLVVGSHALKAAKYLPNKWCYPVYYLQTALLFSGLIIGAAAIAREIF